MFVPRQIYRRRDLHHQFGGQQQGGVSTPAQFPADAFPSNAGSMSREPSPIQLVPCPVPANDGLRLDEGQRRRFMASRYAGLVVIVSALALMVLKAILPSFDQNGTRPQRMTVNCLWPVSLSSFTTGCIVCGPSCS